ncbi:MAG: N-acetyltransferase [Desulfobacteraceae bacterium]|nr:MAG: N-acetyltransferase [Desulfobacteraceae bacterium]
MVLSPNPTEAVVIRKAIIEDIKPVHRLLSSYGEKGLLLARPLSELYDHLRDFSVLTVPGADEPLVGVCALGICWEDLAEIRSLAVAESHKRKGYGGRLVRCCLEEAVALGLKRVFALTYVDGFFASLGFQRVDKSVLPHKVWADCLRCAKYPDCDETAMVIDLG